MRKKLYFDTEFTGLHQNTTLISIGIVSECGRSFYAEFTDYDQSQVNEWIQNNVISQLHLQAGGLRYGLDASTGTFTYCGKKADIADGLGVWLKQFGPVEMWGDVLAYDWMLFCEIFGGAFGIPSNIHYIPVDFSTVLMTKGLNPDTNRSELSGLPNGTQHNALEDAKILKACAEKVLSLT